MVIAAGLGEGYSGHSGRVGLAFRMTHRGAPLQAVQTHGRWNSPTMYARAKGVRSAGMAVKYMLREKRGKFMRDSLGFSFDCAQFAAHQLASLLYLQPSISLQGEIFDVRVHDASDCS